MFNKKDPLIESVRKIMQENDLRRKVEADLCEELGIFSRKALTRENQVNYDALLEQRLNEALHPNQQKLDVHEPEKDELTKKDFEMLRAGKKAMKEEEQLDEIKMKTALSAYAQRAYDDSSKDYGDNLRRMIVKKFGSEAGKDADKHAASQFYGRGVRFQKDDPLEKAKPSSSMRITKSGKINKQDTKAKKSEIKSRMNMKEEDKSSSDPDFAAPGDPRAPKYKDEIKYKAEMPKNPPMPPKRPSNLEEKAPPGAKFERMVKHIKDKYKKGGLTKQEKSIAYATAWKAKNKEKDNE